MDIKNNYNLKKDSKFLKITTGVVAVTLAVGLSNEYFKSITSNHNTYSFAAAPAASSSSGVIASGNCGEAGHEADVTWQLTQNEGSDTYTLTISGQGKMADFEETSNRITTPWWQYKDKIIKLVVEDGVTNIGARAISDYKALTKVELPNVKTIGEHAFENCKALQTVELPQAQTIGEFAFVECSTLETVTLPKAQTIETGAFSECNSLKTVILPQAQSIDTYAFLECKSLETVTLPKAQTIGQCAFHFCTSLETVTLSQAQTIGYCAFLKCTSLETVTLPQAQLIDTYAFLECTSLETVELPNVKTIGKGAFNRCENLNKVTLPRNVELKGNNIFKDSPNVKFFDLDENQFELLPNPAPSSSSRSNEAAPASFSSSGMVSVESQKQALPNPIFDNGDSNVDSDDDEDDSNIHLDKELTDIEPLETPQEVATETDGTAEPSPTTATTTNTNIPNTGAQNNGLLAVILTILGGALGLISKKHRENN